MADELDPVEQQFVADMAEYLSAIQDAVDSARQFAESNLEAKAAVDEMRDGSAEAASALGDLFRHSDEVIAAQHEMRDSAMEAGEALGHVRDEAAEASHEVKNLGQSADETAARLDLMGLSGASTVGMLGPLVSMMGALVVAAAAVAPAAGAMGLGFGAFGLMAVPVIHQVTSGLQQISQAQQAVQQATTAAARNRALAQLHQDWASMPAPIAATVREILAFKNEFTSLAQSSGIEHAVLGDITRVLGIARQLLPVIVPLAQQGAIAIGNMLSAVSSGIRSTGFVDFMHTMTALVVPASAAIGHLAGAVLGLLGHALVSLAPLSIPFINFLTVLVHALSGPLVAALHVVITLFLGLAHAIEPLLPGISKIATALITDLGGSFGAFIPLITQIIGLLGGDLLKILTDLEPVIANFLTPNSPFISALQIIPAILRVILPLFTGLASVLANPLFAHLAVDIISMVIAFRGLLGVLSLARAGFALLTAVMNVNPIFLIITAIGLLVVAFVELWNRSAAFRNFWIGLWHDIWAAVGPAVKMIGGIIEAAFEAWLKTSQAIWDSIVLVFRTAWDLISGIVRLAVTAIRESIVAEFDFIRGLIDAFLQLIQGHWGAAWHDLVSATGTYLRAIVSTITQYVAGFGMLLYHAGQMVVQGLINGIGSMLGSLGSMIGHVAGSILGGLGGLLGIHSPARATWEQGFNITAGWANGMLAAVPMIAAAVAHVAGLVSGAHLGAPAVAAAALVAGGVLGGGRAQAAAPMTVNVPIVMNGQMTPQALHDLQDFVQEAVLRYLRDNQGTGMFLPGRLS